MASDIDVGPTHHSKQSRPPGSYTTSPSAADAAEAASSGLAVAVSIVSGSQLLREGLVLLLASHLRLDLIGSYPTEPGAAGALPNPPGHVVLVDGSPDRDLAVRWTRYWRGLPDPPYLIVIELANDIDLI